MNTKDFTLGSLEAQIVGAGFDPKNLDALIAEHRGYLVRGEGKVKQILAVGVEAVSDWTDCPDLSADEDVITELLEELGVAYFVLPTVKRGKRGKERFICAFDYLGAMCVTVDFADEHKALSAALCHALSIRALEISHE